MYDLFFGAFAACFGVLALVQLVSQKAINLNGYTDRSENPKLFWQQTLLYAAGCMGGILFIL